MYSNEKFLRLFDYCCDSVGMGYENYGVPQWKLSWTKELHNQVVIAINVWEWVIYIKLTKSDGRDERNIIICEQSLRILGIFQRIMIKEIIYDFGLSKLVLKHLTQQWALTTTATAQWVEWCVGQMKQFECVFSFFKQKENCQNDPVWDHKNVN